jgi:hypothetical protein
VSKKLMESRDYAAVEQATTNVLQLITDIRSK